MMTPQALTKAHLINAINKSLKFTVIELPYDLKDQAKSDRLQAMVRDALTRARYTSIAVIVLDLPKEPR